MRPRPPMTPTRQEIIERLKPAEDFRRRVQEACCSILARAESKPESAEEDCRRSMDRRVRRLIEEYAVVGLPYALADLRTEGLRAIAGAIRHDAPLRAAAEAALLAIVGDEPPAPA